MNRKNFPAPPECSTTTTALENKTSCVSFLVHLHDTDWNHCAPWLLYCDRAGHSFEVLKYQCIILIGPSQSQVVFVGLRSNHIRFKSTLICLRGLQTIRGCCAVKFPPAQSFINLRQRPLNLPFCYPPWSNRHGKQRGAVGKSQRASAA